MSLEIINLLKDIATINGHSVVETKMMTQQGVFPAAVCNNCLETLWQRHLDFCSVSHMVKRGCNSRGAWGQWSREELRQIGMKPFASTDNRVLCHVNSN